MAEGQYLWSVVRFVRILTVSQDKTNIDLRAVVAISSIHPIDRDFIAGHMCVWPCLSDLFTKRLVSLI